MDREHLAVIAANGGSRGHADVLRATSRFECQGGVIRNMMNSRDQSRSGTTLGVDYRVRRKHEADSAVQDTMSESPLDDDFMTCSSEWWFVSTGRRPDDELPPSGACARGKGSHDPAYELSTTSG